MKIALTFFAIVVMTQSAFSMTKKELTTKVISDSIFLQSVETNIKQTFRSPEAVKLKFVSVGAQMNREPYFLANFQYDIEAERTEMGLCSYTVQGKINGASLIFEKIVQEDCGE
jgi:hypothetical protein